MKALSKLLRWVLHALPLFLFVLGVFLCASAIIEYPRAEAEIDRQMEQYKESVEDEPLSLLVFLPVAIAEGISLALVLAFLLAIYFIGCGAFAIGILIASFAKKAPPELRRAGILLNSALLVIAMAIYVCGYFS